MSVRDLGDGDAEILRIANQLIAQLRIDDFKPTRVSWEGRMISGLGTFTGPRLRLVPPGLCKFTWDEIMLPEDLKGKLEPEEWRPLLESSLVYESKLKLKKTLGIVSTVAASILLDIALVVILAVVDPVVARDLLVPNFFISILLLILGIPFVNPFLRSLRLQADRISAQYLGREPSLQVLEKINGLELRDKDPGGRLARRPSIEERIRALKRL